MGRVYSQPPHHYWRIQPTGGGTPFEAGLPERAWGFNSLILRGSEEIA